MARMIKVRELTRAEDGFYSEFGRYINADQILFTEPQSGGLGGTYITFIVPGRGFVVRETEEELVSLINGQNA